MLAERKRICYNFNSYAAVHFILPAAYGTDGLSEGNGPACAGREPVRKTRRKGEVTFQ